MKESHMQKGFNPWVRGPNGFDEKTGDKKIS
jgi:hypothetical protein